MEEKLYEIVIGTFLGIDRQGVGTNVLYGLIPLFNFLLKKILPNELEGFVDLILHVKEMRPAADHGIFTIVPI